MTHVQQIDEDIRFDCSKLFNWTTFKTWILRGHDQARNTSVLLHEGHITEDVISIYIDVISPSLKLIRWREHKHSICGSHD